MNVLVTGGAGYIGSHAVQRLLADGHTVVAVDSLFRGHRAAIERLMPTAGGRLHFAEGDIANRELLIELMRKHAVTGVMHFAALTYVGESVTQPLAYYHNNTAATLSLIQAVDSLGGQVDRFVFSSTCATYGEPAEQFIPIPETCPQAPINPYGASKLFVEHMLFDYTASLRDPSIKRQRSFAFAALRYFNVAGCDSTGVLGEHHDPETHLIPVVLQAVLGQRDGVTIFGTDYPTPDGTCIRDYVHVEDLIDAHITVLQALKPGDTRTYNLGIGKGYSVREIIQSVQRVTGKQFPINEGARRLGDPPRLFADPRKIKAELGWQARHTDLDQIVQTAWNWFQANPRGYAK